MFGHVKLLLKFHKDLTLPFTGGTGNTVTVSGKRCASVYFIQNS